MKNELLCIMTVVVLLIPWATAEAAVTTISTLPNSGEVSRWVGDTASVTVATVGQTITVPLGYSSLDSWSFWVDDFGTGFGYDTVEFKGYVMAWDGSKATGSILYESGAQTTHGLPAAEQFTFNPGGLVLTPGGQYVLFISASNYFDGFNSVGRLSKGSTAYAGGQFVFIDNGANFSLVTTQNWNTTMCTNDMGFEAAFSDDGGVVPVPLPGAVLLTSIGSGFVAWLRWRKMLV